MPALTADYSTIEGISRALALASDELANMADAVARARQIRDYDSDRRKRALSLAVRDFLSEGDSATSAEHKARSSDSYQEMMKQTGMDLIRAEKTIADYDACKIRWETARSLLSVQKQIVGNL